MIIFKHKVLQFTPEGILNQLGITPADGAVYYSYFGEVASIIETQVLTTAERLNQLLKEAYQKDMAMIPEYSNFPAYFTVMDVALSQPRNVGIYYDGGLIQAKFVDIDGLGDLGDLQRIQKMVHPGGTLQGWIGIYNSWLAGKSKLYEDVVGARIGIMLSETKAPFWEAMELGNGDYAYPRNGPMRTLLTFTSVYIREMQVAYQRTLAVARALISKAPTIFIGYQLMTVDYNNQLFSGHAWTSPNGTIVFAVSGTTAVDKLGRLTGNGFILNELGMVMKKWSGWLPK